MTLEERLKKNPPAQSKAKTTIGDKTPVSIDAQFNKIEKKVNGKDVAITRGKLGNLAAGNTPSKPYSDTFK